MIRIIKKKKRKKYKDSTHLIRNIIKVKNSYLFSNKNLPSNRIKVCIHLINIIEMTICNIVTKPLKILIFITIMKINLNKTIFINHLIKTLIIIFMNNNFLKNYKNHNKKEMKKKTKIRRDQESVNQCRIKGNLKLSLKKFMLRKNTQ